MTAIGCPDCVCERENTHCMFRKDREIAAIRFGTNGGYGDLLSRYYVCSKDVLTVIVFTFGGFNTLSYDDSVHYQHWFSKFMIRGWVPSLGYVLYMYYVCSRSLTIPAIPRPWSSTEHHWSHELLSCLHILLVMALFVNRFGSLCLIFSWPGSNVCPRMRIYREEGVYITVWLNIERTSVICIEYYVCMYVCKIAWLLYRSFSWETCWPKCSGARSKSDGPLSLHRSRIVSACMWPCDGRLWIQVDRYCALCK